MIRKLKIALLLIGLSLIAACGGAVETDLPNAPTSVKAVSAANAIKLSWKDNSQIETGFVIYREEVNTTGLKLAALAKLAEVGQDVNEYTDSAIDINKTYRYSVTAKNDKGENPSDPADNRTQAVQATPSEGFRLTINRPGSGAGTITSTPAGINCNYETGKGCDFVFAKGTKVNLTVTPNADSEFQGWDVEGCEGTGGCEITIDGAKIIPVVLLRTKATITVDKTIGTGKGSVTSIPQGIDCGASCSSSWNTPIEVFLTAKPDAATSSSFVEWQGCPKVEGASGQFCRVKQTDPGLVKIGAKFNLPEPVITTFVSDKPKVAEGGSATLSWDIADSGNTDVSLSLNSLPTGTTEPQVIDISAKTLKDSIVVTPAVSTTYTLIAKSASGDSEKKEVIVSIGDATTISFTATDTNPADSTPDVVDVKSTDTVRLSWTIAGEAPFTLSLTKTTGASTVSVSVVGKNAEADFVDEIPGATSTYTLKAVNSLGVESSATVSVEVGAEPVVDTFTLAGGDTTVASGSTIKLDWTITSLAPVTAQTLTENAVPIVVIPTTRTLTKVLSTPTDTPETYTYELVATNRFGSSAKPSAPLSLSVGKPATITNFSAADTTVLVGAGNTVTLNWSATGSEPITFKISRSNSPTIVTLSAKERTLALPGSATPGDVTYSIVAENAFGATTLPQSLVVTFGNVPSITSFTATADVGKVILNWAVNYQGAKLPKLVITRNSLGSAEAPLPINETTIPPYEDTGLNPDIVTYTYKLTASNEFGSADPVTRKVGPPAP